MKKTLATLVATVVIGALAACGSDEPAEPAATSAAPTTPAATTPEPTATADASTADITIADGEVTPQGDRVEVKVGEEVRLHVVSDAVDEVHVHSDPEHSFDVEPGTDETFTFTVDTPGQVAVELHDLGVTVLQLVVRP